MGTVSMPINPCLIRQERAAELIAEMGNSTSRLLINLVTEGVIEFHDANPPQLMSSFDLAFFVEVLKERIDDISGLLRGTVPIEYWFGDPQPYEVDADHDSGPTGLRSGQAYNYAAMHEDKRVQAALLGLKERADLKQTLLMPSVKRWGSEGITPPVPAAPAQPFDYLFMVMAVDYALRPGGPVRSRLRRHSEYEHRETRLTPEGPLVSVAFAREALKRCLIDLDRKGG